jgi:hypothetical protein
MQDNFKQEETKFQSLLWIYFRKSFSGLLDCLDKDSRVTDEPAISSVHLSEGSTAAAVAANTVFCSRRPIVGSL